ncbi:hypothetical protein AT5G40315, partial [Arabidopsis thaliana]|jgi:hypothetical protein
MKSQ